MIAKIFSAFGFAGNQVRKYFHSLPHTFRRDRFVLDFGRMRTNQDEEQLELLLYKYKMKYLNIIDSILK